MARRNNARFVYDVRNVDDRSATVYVYEVGSTDAAAVFYVSTNPANRYASLAHSGNSASDLRKTLTALDVMGIDEVTYDSLYAGLGKIEQGFFDNRTCTYRPLSDLALSVFRLYRYQLSDDSVYDELYNAGLVEIYSKSEREAKERLYRWLIDNGHIDEVQGVRLGCYDTPTIPLPPYTVEDLFR